MALRMVAVVLGLVGAVWLLQGVGVLPGSFMTGQAFWAWVGAACLAMATALLWRSFRRR